ncbi:hypothetical protein NFI96_024879, partial [Prochilodus magdalenae]
NPRVTKADLNLIQLIKAGKEGVFYKAKMMRGTCKGHALVTCKIAKEGVSVKQLEKEVSIMRKLLYHKNVLQLLDWNTAEEPFVLIMEFVSYGTLRNFVQTHREKLSTDPELQSLFTIASYHIATAMEHMRSKMVVHCDLALRNILVGRFPWEIKVAEFGLSRDLTRMRSRRSTRKKQNRERVPLRWYPPEYFRNNYYSFKGDVWSFGIVLWEMQTFGSLPYPTLETSEQVVYYICAGHRNVGPDTCRPEILQIMSDCWSEPYTARPSFSELVQILENIIENDSAGLKAALKMFLRVLEIIFFFYFATHIPITLFIDLQALLPEHVYPQALKDVLHWYAADFKDPMVLDPPFWFKSFVFCEALVQLPFFPVAAYAFLKGNCRWIRTPAIVYSTHVATSLIPILAHILFYDFPEAPHPGPRTSKERLTLVSIYAPYLVVPILMLLTMLLSTAYSSAPPSGKASSKAKKLK